MMHTHLNDEYETLLTHSEINDWREVAALAQNVDRVWVAECCASFSLLSRPLTFSLATFSSYRLLSYLLVNYPAFTKRADSPFHSSPFLRRPPHPHVSPNPRLPTSPLLSRHRIRHSRLRLRRW